jgi:multicomponent Na+:H+ antiporter subunit E
MSTSSREVERTIWGRVVLVLWLAAVWTALWGTVEVGTVVAGGLIGTLVTVALRTEVPGSPGRVRPLAAARFAVVFLAMLVQATAQVVAAVVTPKTRVAPSVVAVRLPASSPLVVTVVSNSITLTPGTITLDAVRNDDGTADLLVHALDASDPAAVRADALRLHRYAVAVVAGPVSDLPEEPTA